MRTWSPDHAGAHGMQVFELHRLREVSGSEEFSADVVYSDFGKAHNLAVNAEDRLCLRRGDGHLRGRPAHGRCLDADQPGFRGLSRRGEDARCAVRGLSRPRRRALRPGDMRRLQREPRGGCRRDRQDRPHDPIVNGVRRNAVCTPGVAHGRSPVLPARRRVRRVPAEPVHAHARVRHDRPGCAGAPVRHDLGTTATDHNLYVLGNRAFEANYTSGLRVLEFDDLAAEDISEIAFFDTYPASAGRSSTAPGACTRTCRRGPSLSAISVTGCLF